MDKKGGGTFLSSHRLFFNLSQPLHELFFLALYPLLLLLCILSLFLLILQLGPEKFANTCFSLVEQLSENYKFLLYDINTEKYSKSCTLILT